MANSNVIIILCWLFVNSVKLSDQRKNTEFPPGPNPSKVVGNLLQLGDTPYKKIADWKSRYGPIISLQFGDFPTVAISDHNLIREAMDNSNFDGRPRIDLLIDRVGGKPEGILFTDGRQWQEQRQFTINQFNTFGFGKKSLEGIIQSESREMTKALKKEAGKPIDLSRHFKSTVANIMWTIMTGQRFAAKDPTLSKIIKLIEANSAKNTLLTGVTTFIPSIAKLAPNLSGYNKAMTPVIELVKFLRPYIDQHRDTFRERHLRDYVDAYLNEMNKTSDPDSSLHKSKYDSMVYTVTDLLVAGVETVGATLNWMSNILVRHPSVQERLGSEIYSIVGKSRLPALTDRTLMPYTNAVIAEVMRYRTLVPISIFHRTTNNVEFHGFHIPNNTMILPNLYAAHHDPKVWGDPETFRPERFLTADGLFATPDAFMPFATGHRHCAGIKVARDELFLLISAFFQTFKITNPKGIAFPRLDPLESALSLPRIQKLVVEVRR